MKKVNFEKFMHQLNVYNIAFSGVRSGQKTMYYDSKGVLQAKMVIGAFITHYYINEN